ncbi:hypothetical protein PAECIP111893_02427 [Paenibacillus plantiphilus]|uniref:Inhibitor of sigma-G Gin n=1 Tax=Paenibacillus plantiphilus TaxID=2905650 RepID=A0ABM9C8W9_9BACL|nr:hypothetical protein PAECIP111893_02427 [Paenibacillus plantiphilus]
MENPIVQAQERFNNRPPIRHPWPVGKACECGEYEAVSVWKGHRLCEDCLEGIVGVTLI